MTKSRKPSAMTIARRRTRDEQDPRKRVITCEKCGTEWSHAAIAAALKIDSLPSGARALKQCPKCMPAGREFTDQDVIMSGIALLLTNLVANLAMNPGGGFLDALLTPNPHVVLNAADRLMGRLQDDGIDLTNIENDVMGLVEDTKREIVRTQMGETRRRMGGIRKPRKPKK